MKNAAAGKKPKWMFAMAMSAIGFGGFLFLGEGDLPSMRILASILGIGTGCVPAMSPSIQANEVDCDAFLASERKEGAYFAVATFLMKSASGIVVVFAGFALDGVGYIPNVEQSEETEQALRLLSDGFPLTAYSLSFVIFRRYLHCSPGRHQHDRDELDKRREIARERSFTGRPSRGRGNARIELPSRMSRRLHRALRVDLGRRRFWAFPAGMTGSSSGFSITSVR